MNYRIQFQPLAVAEMVEAYHWIREQSPPAAKRWLDGLQKAISTLEVNPRRCPLARESDAFPEEVRQLLYGRRRGVYRILFVIRGDPIHVVSIRHSARQPLRIHDLDLPEADSR